MRNTLLFALATVCLMAVIGYVASRFMVHSAAPALPVASVIASAGSVPASPSATKVASGGNPSANSSSSSGMPSNAPAKSSAAPAAPTSDVLKQLNALIAKVQAKLPSGARTEQNFAPELQEFDAILAAHKGEKTDDVAQVAVMKAALYLEVFDQQQKAVEMFKQLEQDYPGTPTAQKLAAELPGLEAQVAADAESAAIRRTLVSGAVFPDFAVKDLNGQPLSVAKFKGQIVLVDFWATWCGPCMAEMPNVIQAYNQYHGKGFEIIGISLDESAAPLTAYLKEGKVTWPQFSDFKGWSNELAKKYGVHSIPANYLIGRDGRIISNDLRGEDLAKAVDAALLAK